MCDTNASSTTMASYLATRSKVLSKSMPFSWLYLRVFKTIRKQKPEPKLETDLKHWVIEPKYLKFLVRVPELINFLVFGLDTIRMFHNFGYPKTQNFFYFIFFFRTFFF